MYYKFKFYLSRLMSKKLNNATWSLIIFQVVFWTLVPLYAHHAPPLDVTEMHGWGMTFQWGFYKHPPMPTWIVAISQLLVGKNMLSLLLPASVSIAATYWCVGWLAGKMLPEKEAIVALFLYALTIFCNLWSTDFNHNQIQMPFWALSLVVLYCCLQSGSLWMSFLLGVVMGLNALSKYTAALIVPCAIALLIYSRYWRQHFNWKMLALASLGFFLIFGSHIIWLIDHQFMPFRYLGDRFEQLNEEKSAYVNLLNYIGNIFLAHALMLLATIYLFARYRPTRNTEVISSNNRDFLWFLGFGPVLITLVMGLFGTQLYERWVTPMLPMISIGVIYLLKNRASFLFNKKFLVIFLILQLLMGFGYIYKGKINQGKSSRGSYPAPEITQAIYEQWHQKFPNAPFRIVAGGEYEAGFVSLFSPEKTYVFTEANSTFAPWVSEVAANQCGMVMIAPTAQEKSRFPRVEDQAPIKIDQIGRGSQIVVEWAIVPPQGLCPLN